MISVKNQQEEITSRHPPVENEAAYSTNGNLLLHPPMDRFGTAQLECHVLWTNVAEKKYCKRRGLLTGGGEQSGLGGNHELST